MADKPRAVNVNVTEVGGVLSDRQVRGHRKEGNSPSPVITINPHNYAPKIAPTRPSNSSNWKGVFCSLLIEVILIVVFPDLNRWE